MKKRNGILIILTVMLLLMLSFPMTAMANSAEPPGFVILVSGAPEELVIFMKSGTDTQTEPILLRKQQKNWETYYRYYYHMEPGEFELTQAVLQISGGGYDFVLALPAETFGRYNNLLTLDLEGQTLTAGQPVWRMPLLIGIRVLLTLLIEGAIFWMFGYREKVSWIMFLVINLLTQTGLNLSLAQSVPGGYSYWGWALILVEVLVLIVEIIAYRLFLWENKKSKGTGFAFVSNMASLCLGALLMMLLPI